MNVNTREWLLNSDPSIAWQVHKYLLKSKNSEYERIRKKVAEEGWGKRLLDLQDAEGTWARAIYSPKWTSTTYTMLLLKSFGLEPNHIQAQKGCFVLLDNGFYKDGGINFWKSWKHGETCVTAMVLSLLSYFNIEDDRMPVLFKWLLGQQMHDGGWNCESFRGARHSSVHTTISVLEALRDYTDRFPEKVQETKATVKKAHEFLLTHHLYKSDRSGEIINPKFTMFSFPVRWKYDVLRALDYFQSVQAPKDERMQDAKDLLMKKRLPDGTWKLQNKHGGKVFFDLEKVGKPSRWNTLRALKVLSWWQGIES